MKSRPHRMCKFVVQLTRIAVITLLLVLLCVTIAENEKVDAVGSTSGRNNLIAGTGFGPPDGSHHARRRGSAKRRMPVENSVLIRTSEGADPSHTLLIQAVNPGSKPQVRYYQNYPVDWHWRRTNGKRPYVTTKASESATGKIIIISEPPGGREGHRRRNHSRRPGDPRNDRYGSHYLNWKGLRYGECRVRQENPIREIG